MNEEAASSTHLRRLLGIQIEGAWLGNGRVMHGVLAVAELVLGSGERAGVNDALLGRVHVALVLP